MYWRVAGALILLGALAGCQREQARTYPGSEFVAATVWRMSPMWFGGFSAIEVSDDGVEFIVLSDRGRLVQGQFVRRADVIDSVQIAQAAPVTAPAWGAGDTPSDDLEGLAGWIGDLAMSYERVHKISVARPLSAPPRWAPDPPVWDGQPDNSGYEALAVDAAGRLLAIPERSGDETLGFPVYRLERGGWEAAFSISRTDDFLPVGADVGPDGMLYVLERDFTGFAFRSRVRRFALDATGTRPGEPLLQTAAGRHDNLEGIAVWRDADGFLRLTMVADDNFRLVQRTEFVEYRLVQESLATKVESD